MENQLILNVQLSVIILKKEKWYLAGCPALDVFSQGETEQKAEDNLKEALCLFLTSCIERGTLDAVLKECGFRLTANPSKKDKERYITIPIHLLSDRIYPCHA